VLGGQADGGFFELAGLDAGVDEEAYTDAERDETGGGTAEDCAHLQDGGESDEEEDEATGAAEQDDAGATGVATAARAVTGGFAVHDGELFFGGWQGNAFGDGGKALLALQFAPAVLERHAGDDDAGDHGTAGDGDAERAVKRTGVTTEVD